MTQPPYNPLEPTVPPVPEPQTPPPSAETPATPGYQPASPDYPPQAPQALQQAPYPPGQPQQPQYAAPAYSATQPPAPKKRKTGMIVAIIVVAVAIVAAGGYFGFKAVVGNRLTPYCRTFISVGSQMEDLSSRMTTASAEADLDEMSQIMGEMITLFDQLRDSSPPDTVSPSLDTVSDYLTHVKGYIDSGDITGFLEYMSQSDASEFATAASTVDTASVDYCNG